MAGSVKKSQATAQDSYLVPCSDSATQIQASLEMQSGNFATTALRGNERCHSPSPQGNEAELFDQK